MLAKDCNILIFEGSINSIEITNLKESTNPLNKQWSSWWHWLAYKVLINDKFSCCEKFCCTKSCKGRENACYKWNHGEAREQSPDFAATILCNLDTCTQETSTSAFNTICHMSVQDYKEQELLHRVAGHNELCEKTMLFQAQKGADAGKCKLEFHKHKGGNSSEITSCCKPRTLASLSCFCSTACTTAASMHLFSASTWESTLALETAQSDTVHKSGLLHSYFS